VVPQPRDTTEFPIGSVARNRKLSFGLNLARLDRRPCLALGAVARPRYRFVAAYLWHLPVFTATQRYLADVPVAGRAVIACAITAIVTSLSWFLVERPFLRWKSRLDHRAPRPITVRPGCLGTLDVAAEPGIDQQPDRVAAHLLRLEGPPVLHQPDGSRPSRPAPGQ
jgi:hypothetical protein